MHQVALILTACLLCPAAGASNIVAVSTFDSGLDGWTPDGRTCAISNPGGFLRVQDVDSNWARPLAPTQFLGDWRSVGRVSFTVRPDASIPMKYQVGFRVRNAQNQTSEFLFPLAATPAGVWSTVSVRIGTGAGNWNIPAAIRGAVTQFGLSIDVNDNFLDGGSIELDDVDDVTLWAACPSDLNNDGFVDDEDFVLFSFAYNLLDCADPSMPPGCPADLNDDGFVDDADFLIFLPAYGQLLCE